MSRPRVPVAEHPARTARPHDATAAASRAVRTRPTHRSCSAPAPSALGARQERKSDGTPRPRYGLPPGRLGGCTRAPRAATVPTDGKSRPSQEAGRQRQTRGDPGTQSHGTRESELAGLPKSGGWCASRPPAPRRAHARLCRRGDRHRRHRVGTSHLARRRHRPAPPTDAPSPRRAPSRPTTAPDGASARPGDCPAGSLTLPGVRHRDSRRGIRTSGTPCPGAARTRAVGLPRPQ